MKKVFFMLALVASMAFAACNSNATVENNDSTTDTTETVTDTVADTVATDSIMPLE